MKKLLLLLIPLILQAQNTQRPDCFLPVNVPVGSVLPFNIGPFDNRTAGCTTWSFVYNSYTYSALSIVVQTAPNVSAGVPGSWSTFTANTGSNPATNTTSGVATFGGITSYFPWLRIQLTSATGAGTISGELYGWRIPAAGSSTAVISGTVDVDQIGNGTFFSGQQSVTASAVALATNSAREVCVKAFVGNQINVYIGTTAVTTSTGDELSPGEGRCYHLSNTNKIFVRASTTGASVSWSGTNQ